MDRIYLDTTKNDTNALYQQLIEQKEEYKRNANELTVIMLLESLKNNPDIKEMEIFFHEEKILGEWEYNFKSICKDGTGNILLDASEYMENSIYFDDVILKDWVEINAGKKVKITNNLNESALILAKFFMGDELGEHWYKSKITTELAEHLDQTLDKRETKKSPKI